jgi:hypothetical protein
VFLEHANPGGCCRPDANATSTIAAVTTTAVNVSPAERARLMGTIIRRRESRVIDPLQPFKAASNANPAGTFLNLTGSLRLSVVQTPWPSNNGRVRRS